MVKQLDRLVILFVLLPAIAVRAYAGGVSLAWDPVVNAAVAGYKVYYGPTAGNYTSYLDISNTTTCTVVNLVEGQTYHFAATAYDTAHTESAFSNDVSTTVSYSAPVANFGASTTTGIAPVAMNFINTSTGTISTYSWSFGDGTTSTAQNPTHVYSSAGVYNLSLTVTGPGGSDTTLRRYQFF
jgi:PKD repeat protein